MRTNDVFKNTELDDVTQCYIFDRKIRALITEIPEDVEITSKSLMSYIHTKNHGPIGYESSESFCNISEYAKMINKIIGLKK